MPSKIRKASITSTGAGYFHDLDPYRFHGTKAEATKDRTRMLQGGFVTKSRKPRVSTFYTILQDKRKNNPTKFGNVPQGPHTFPHHGIHRGIAMARQQKRMNIFDSLIPSPAQYNARVDMEIPANHAKRLRANIAKDIFAVRHKRFKLLNALGSKRSEGDDVRFAHVINKLLQMDPFGSYAYKGKGAGKRALSGKGESSTQPLQSQIDLPKNHGFTDISGVTTRNQSILKALNGVGIK